MIARSLGAFVLACAVLALPLSACRHGGGSPPCPDQTSSTLRLADGAPAGDLRVEAGAGALLVAFRPSDGAPFEGAFLIGTSEGAFRYSPESSGDPGVSIPWEGLADDACGQTITVAVEAFPDQGVAFTVVCSDGAPTEAATGPDGTSGGAGNCPR